MLDISRYETMTMLNLPDGERERLGKRINSLMSGFEILKQVDTDGIEPLITTLDLNNIMREDIAEKFLTRDDILMNAPEQYDGYFKVPGTIN